MSPQFVETCISSPLCSDGPVIVTSRPSASLIRDPARFFARLSFCVVVVWSNVLPSLLVCVGIFLNLGLGTVQLEGVVWVGVCASPARCVEACRKARVTAGVLAPGSRRAQEVASLLSRVEGRFLKRPSRHAKAGKPTLLWRALRGQGLYCACADSPSTQEFLFQARITC